ncbi:hypothetical protein [Neisseria perflava]|uniref:hypothetical protein n=1 Tax=Neisseria perflava TaxID=33053 RepID=UPI0020A0A35F|nr:hypothetical protein [Neisseria perflava]MCP1660100.1 peptidoglycan hydrolase CwlO-like protein [Neisseria perflava]MCP1772766.1 peptidoglycan hydrolase CwlO-like protein [Neisseria perflava]
MKHILLLLAALSTAAPVLADQADDVLHSAQANYRAVLKKQSDNDSKIISLQTDLTDAQERQRKAQEDITRLQGELQTATSLKSQQATELQQAGQQLDSAWNAVYGPGGTRAGGQ